MAPLEQQLVVHRDPADRGPQQLDLIVSLVRLAGSSAPPAHRPGTPAATAPGSPLSRRARALGCPGARPAVAGAWSPSPGALKTVRLAAHVSGRGPPPHPRAPAALSCVCSWPPPRRSITPPSEASSETLGRERCSHLSMMRGDTG